MKLLANVCWGIMVWATGMLADIPLLLADIQLGPISQLTAVGALVAALFFLLKVYIPSRDQQYADMITSITESHQQALRCVTDRHEHWESVRHRDHQELAKAINDLRVNCSEFQMRLRGEQKEAE